MEARRRGNLPQGMKARAPDLKGTGQHRLIAKASPKLTEGSAAVSTHMLLSACRP